MMPGGPPCVIAECPQFKNLAQIMALKRVGRKSVFGLSCIDAITDADADADANGDGCAVG